MTREPVFFNDEPIVGRMPLFIPELRQAVRDDRKTQTRRVVKNPEKMQGLMMEGEEPDWCPYGKPGDHRCMTEPLIRVNRAGRDIAAYKDDGQLVTSLITKRHIAWRWSKDLLTSIHMPTAAARTVCRYKEIRVERLQNIRPSDALKEGVELLPCDHPICDRRTGCKQSRACRAFHILWDYINQARGYAWDKNDWVWVLKFKRVGDRSNRTHCVQQDVQDSSEVPACRSPAFS